MREGGAESFRERRSELERGEKADKREIDRTKHAKRKKSNQTKLGDSKILHPTGLSYATLLSLLFSSSIQQLKSLILFAPPIHEFRQQILTCIYIYYIYMLECKERVRACMYIYSDRYENLKSGVLAHVGRSGFRL